MKEDLQMKYRIQGENRMKHFTIMHGLDQRKKVPYCPAAHGKMPIEAVIEIEPDLEHSIPLKTLYDDSKVKHIIICIYWNENGEQKRRIAGMGFVPKDDEQVKEIMSEVADSIGIHLDRSLTLVNPPK